MKNLSSQVYSLVQAIPAGKVTTYKSIATSLGNPHLARAIGNILHNNPLPFCAKEGADNNGKVPCHRVVNSKGGVAKNFGNGGMDNQILLLQREGVSVNDGVVDLEIFGWDCNKKI